MKGFGKELIMMRCNDRDLESHDKHSGFPKDAEVGPGFLKLMSSFFSCRGIWGVFNVLGDL